MKYFFLFLYSISLALFNPSFSSAQNPDNTDVEIWDWQKCLEYALQNNLQLKQSDINIALSESTLKQNKLNYTPSINGSSNYNLSVGNNYNFFTAEYTKAVVHYQDYGLNVSQPIFDGLVAANNIKKGKLDVEALQFDKENLKNTIELQVLTAFLNIMNANEQFVQAVNQKKSTTEQYDRMKALIDAGAAAENALLDIDAQLTNEDLSIAQIKNQLDLAYLNLKILLQLDIKKDIKVKIPELPEQLSISPLSEINAIYEKALTLRPEVKSSQLKIQSAKKAIDAAKGYYYPTLNLVANANTFFTNQSKNISQVLTGNTTAVGFVEGSFERVLIPETQTIQSKNPYSNQLNQNFSYAFGLNLAVPIYNKNQAQTAVKQAKLQHEVALLSEKQTEMELYNTIQQAYLKANAAIDNYKAATKNFTTSQKSYDYSVERMNAGSINQLEVNLAKTNLLNATSRLTQAKYEYLFNTKVLDFYEGKEITLE